MDLAKIKQKYLHISPSPRTWHPTLENLIGAVHSSPSTETKNNDIELRIGLASELEEMSLIVEVNKTNRISKIGKELKVQKDISLTQNKEKFPLSLTSL